MFDKIVAAVEAGTVSAADFAPFIGHRVPVEFDNYVDIGCKLVSFNTLLNIVDITDSDGVRRSFPAGDLATRYISA